MKAPAVPQDEAARLAELERLRILDTEAEADFDGVTRLAAHIFGAPISLVSLVDGRRQWFKSRFGLDATETPREVSFCGHAVAQGSLLVVPDAHADPRFHDNPLVTGQPLVRFYAGAPLTTEAGRTLGTLCVIDHQPRQPSAAQIAHLEVLAQQVMRLFELRSHLREAQTVREHLEEVIAHSEELEHRHSQFFAVNLDMLCIAGFDGFFKELNPAWSRLLGWTSEELRARPFVEFVHPADRERTAKEAGRLGVGGVTVEFKNRYQARDGSYRWLAWSATADVKRSLIYAVARDITAERKVEALKDEFVSTVSHELRTPLTSIRGSLRLVRGGVVGQVPASAMELIDIACNNTDRLMRLINDLLDLEKMQAGKLDMKLEETHVAALLAEAVAAIGGMADTAGVRVEVEAEAEQQAALASLDRDRVMQVLANLLSNAVKWSPKGSCVTVGLRASASSVRVEVRDCGPGIPAEQGARLFRRFEQIDGSDARPHGGTGLGLAISKAIVEEHEGRIGYTSTVGHGSTFWFELPVASRAPDPLLAAEADGATILLLEDDADLRRLLELVLLNAGYRVVCAASVADARAALATVTPCLFVLDMNLPDGSGAEVLLAARADPRTADIPAIVVTGDAAPGTPHAVIVDWLQKPLDPERLLSAVRHASRAPGPPRALVIEDDPDTLRVIIAQLAALGVEAQGTRDGREALGLAVAHPPDLVVLDVGLPGTDGFEVVEWIKQTPHRATPMIVYTGRDLNSLEKAALRLGETVHLTKSRVTAEAFELSVLSLLKRAAAPPEP